MPDAEPSRTSAGVRRLTTDGMSVCSLMSRRCRAGRGGTIRRHPGPTLNRYPRPGDADVGAAKVPGQLSLPFLGNELVLVFSARRGAHVHAFAVTAVDAQDLDRLTVGGAEPMRHPGVELGDFAWPHDDVVLTKDQAHLA